MGFLDAPGVEADALFDTLAVVLAATPPGAILTVYSDDRSALAGADHWCAGHCAELLAVIPHEPLGATLTLRRTAAAAPNGHAPGVDAHAGDPPQAVPSTAGANGTCAELPGASPGERVRRVR